MDSIRSWWGAKNSNEEEQQQQSSGSNNNNLEASGAKAIADAHELEQMGFDFASAYNALIACNGKVDEALEFLLSPSQVAPAVTANAQSSQESFRSAASVKAGEAAMKRANAGKVKSISTRDKQGYRKKNKPKQSVKASNTAIPVENEILTSNTEQKKHRSNISPSDSDVRISIPTKMSDKPQEEQIIRCVKRLSSYPRTVETLLKTFTLLKNDPTNDAYRKLDSSSAGYKRVIEMTPGAEDLLHAVKFVKRSGSVYWIMQRNHYDPVLLWMAVSALEEAKSSKEYTDAKRKIVFESEVSRIMQVSTEEEVEKLSHLMSSIPSEPTLGHGALVKFIVGNKTFMRKFEGDDILRDVLNWIGGYGTEIRAKLLSREYCLMDMNKSPVSEVNFDIDMDKTLQHVGCWPSGKFELQLSTDEWQKQGKSMR